MRSPPHNPKYERFHGNQPDLIVEDHLWVPGGLVLIGYGVNVGYAVPRNVSSEKAGKNFVHDHEDGVRVYRRAENGEKPNKTYRSFPTCLRWLGQWTGMEFNDGEDVQQVSGSTRTQLYVTPDDRTLIVVHAGKGVLFVIQGGSMHVSDWIYD